MKKDLNLLYNNIELSDSFPPDDISESSFEEIAVPYLQNPPKTIDITVGRQLFVDDFLIERTTLERIEHRPTEYSDNPIFKAETNWETGTPERELEEIRPSAAILFGGGVWYDGKLDKYRMWYTASFHGSVAYAESDDGIHFKRVNSDIYENSNLVLPRGGSFFDTNSVILNHYGENPMQEEYVMSLYVRPERCERVGCNIYTSNDGIHWTMRAHTAGVDDTTTIFYNPFRKKWVYSIKKNDAEFGRRREYCECDTLPQGRELKDRVFWLRADEKDLRHQVWNVRPELYVFNSVAYESIMLGEYTVFKGPQNDISMKRGLPKVTELHIGYSRDGFHYSRQTDRTAFIKPSEKDGKWDCGYIHCPSSICTIQDDRLVFYYSAFAGDSDMIDPNYEERNGMYSNGSIGVAFLRRDGFASMSGKGELITRKLKFDGEYFFINAASRNLRAKITDENGVTISGFEAENCIPFNGDSCKQLMKWKTKGSLSELKGKIIKIRFIQDDGDLYAFWISKSPKGESGGYLAGGEKGKHGLCDI